MPENQYPVFEGGQTLTALGLNQLRDFLHQRDRALGALTGFGVACGLSGTVAGSTLTIGTGLAVDQRGEPLVLAGAGTVALPPDPTDDTFDFVTSGPEGGFSVVLEQTDTVVPTPDCGETDCQAHAELRTRGVALRVVAGRLTGPRFDFAAEPLLKQTPLALSLTSDPIGSYTALKEALVRRLTDAPRPAKIDPTLISRLQGTSISTSDLPGVRGYKAGFLNQVLFTTLSLLRCEALLSVACVRTTTRPGVVLGWVHEDSGSWVWDCAYRHAWEPPDGLTRALLGGSCSDPCGLYRGALEGLIAGFAPPDPAPSGGGGGGGVVVVPDDFVWCPKGTVLAGGRCVNIYYPPPEIPDLWWHPWVETDPLGPVWNPPWDITTLPADVYGGFGWDYFGPGVLNGTPALGGTAASVKESLEARITGLGGTPHVVVTTQADAVGTPGYEPAGSFNPADTIVLTQDSRGTVVATGRVPAGYTARRLGTDLPAAATTATEALDLAGKQATAIAAVGQDVAGLSDRLVGLDTQVGGLLDFRDTTHAWQAQVQQTLGGLDQKIVVEVGSAVGALDRRVAVMEGAVDVLRTRQPGVPGAGGGIPGMHLDQDVAHRMVEFAETVNASLETLVTDQNRRTLGRYVGDAARAAATLEAVAAGGDATELGDAAVTLMSSLRTAVKSAGIDPTLGRQLDAQVTAVRRLLG